MSARTTWRAKPCGWRDRERVVALGEEFGPAGPLVLDLLEELAKEQRGNGVVRSGLRAIARSAFLSPAEGQCPHDLARVVLQFAEAVGAVDDLVIADDTAMTVTLRVSGFAEDQGTGYESVKKTQQRFAARHNAAQGGHKEKRADDTITGACPPQRDSVPDCPPTGQDRTEQNREPHKPNDVESGLFRHWQTVCDHPQAKPTPERLRAIRARLKDGYTPEQIRTAIDGAGAAAFVDQRGKRHDDLTLICRNGSKLEDFIGRAAQRPESRIDRLRVIAAKFEAEEEAKRRQLGAAG